MPRLDGYQTCALIKNNPDYANKPVIMLSSKDGLFDKEVVLLVQMNTWPNRLVKMSCLTPLISIANKCVKYRLKMFKYECL